jgi:hypothetical protein
MVAVVRQTGRLGARLRVHCRGHPCAMSSPGDPESPPKDVPTTEDVDTSPPGTADDVESDPSQGEGSDWTDEGGATPEGPSTQQGAS